VSHFDQVIQILEGPHLRSLRQQALSHHLSHGPVRGGIPIKRDCLGRLTLVFVCLAEKGFSRSHVALCLEHEVHRLAGQIYRPVQINPLATNLQIGFVNTPGPSCGYAKPIPALDELRCKALYPTHNRGVRQRQSPLGHHLDQIAQAELVLTE
jgi:hypothetical protein